MTPCQFFAFGTILANRKANNKTTDSKIKNKK